MDCHIGESTLETLPGTLTPPSAIYSPPPKLTDSCIQNSCTSTPLNFGKDWNKIDLKVPLFNKQLTLKLEALSKKKLKKVTFDVDLLQNNKRRGDLRKKYVRRKEKILYAIYCRLKSGKYKLINTIIAKRFHVTRRVNEGDLIH